MGDLTERVRALEDKSELWELVNRYAVAVDDDDYGTLEGLFTEDASFLGLQGEPTVGVTAVVGYLRHRAETAHKGRVHTPTAQIIESLDGDKASGLVACYAALFAHDDTKTFFSFRYRDQYERHDGHWQFARRQVHGVTNIIP
jgi:hypothetical protein